MSEVSEEALEKMAAAWRLRLPFAQALARDPALIASEYEEVIRSQAKQSLLDPYTHGYTNPVWELVEKHTKELRSQFPKGVVYVVVCGGHRSGKSEFAGSYVTRQLCTKPGATWWCADATEAASRDNQQRYIERYLPIGWRPDESGTLTKKRTKTTKVRFTQAGGFTENVLVLPNKSECRFKFYEQKLGTLQAVALDGFWGDELLPYEWIGEIEWRLVQKDGLFLITFTPYEGYTQTVGHFLDGATVLEEVRADSELLPVSSTEDSEAPAVGERVHRVLQCQNPRARVIFFHSSDNPIFGNWPGVKQKALGQPRHEILMRVYGMVTKAAYAQFPFFSDLVHVVRPELIPEKGSNFLFIDPCDGRNWFMIWVRITEDGKWWVYREWPSHGFPLAYIPGIGDPGPWAVPGKPLDGERGPAQNSFQFGLSQYKGEIERLENKEIIIERRMDIRFGNTPVTEVDGSRTLIEQMEELGMVFEGAVAKEIQKSTALVNELLDYDRETTVGEFSARLARVNQPRMKISSQCPNVIYALKTWTGKDGNKGATKDPIDLLRYSAASDIDFVGEDAFTWKRF